VIATAAAPARVSTSRRRTLQVPFGAMYDWAINHLYEIEQAQQAYHERADR
jgi:hypothetical protein